MSREPAHADINFKVKNRYRVTRLDKDLNVIERSGWSNNLMTDYGFDLFMTTTSYIGLSCVVGAGNTTPSEADEYLQTFVAGTANLKATVVPEYHTSASPRHVLYRTQWRLNPTGSSYSVSEVGIGMEPSSSPAGITSGQKIGSRSLVVDNLGAPTTVSVLGDEYLDIEWELYWYVPEDVSGVVSITDNGTPIDITWTVRASDMSGFGWPQISGGAIYLRGFIPQGGGAANDSSAYATQTLGAYTSRMDGTAYPFGSSPAPWTAASYTPGSKQRDWTLRLNLTAANITGGIGSMRFVIFLGQLQMSFSPKLQKTASKVADLVFTCSMSNV